MSIFSTQPHLSPREVIELTFACAGVFVLTLIGVGLGIFSPSGTSQAASVLISSSQSFGSHTLTLTASTASLNPGTTVNLSWSATNFSHTGTPPCSVTDSASHTYGTGYSSGSYTSSPIFQTTTFTLTCTGAGSIPVTIHLTAPAPPTTTINAGAGNGVAKTVIVGTPVTITASYSPAAGDTLTASAINGSDQTTSVPCANVVPFNESCWTRPDAAKTYTFTPAVGTYTYYASAKTSSYILYDNYASVNLTVVAACSNGSGAAGACTSCNAGYVLNGGMCSLQCPNGSGPAGACTACNAGYILSGGSCVPQPAPVINTFSATPARIQKNISTSVSFSWKIATPPASCTISGPTGFASLSVSPVNGVVGSRSVSVTVSQNSVFTLTCGAIKKTLNIGPVPTVQEY